MTESYKIKIIQPSGEILTPKDEITEFPYHLERAGRTCYKSLDRITESSAEKFCRMIIKRGHESVLEHKNITCRIIGDRSMSHQLVRHRLSAFSQESQRFCNYGKDEVLEVILPPSIMVVKEPTIIEYHIAENGYEEIEIDGTGEIQINHRFMLWFYSIASAYTNYLNLLNNEVPPEDARSVLPNATKTEIVTTFNIRMWRHVFKERAFNSHAQWQIKDIMLSLYKEMNELVPCLFEDLEG